MIAENHVETAAGTKCSISPHDTRPSPREHYSDSRVHKEKTSLWEDYLAHCVNNGVEDFSKVIWNFQKDCQTYSNCTHHAQGIFNRAWILPKYFIIKNTEK